MNSLELYKKLLAAFPKIELKGATMPYTSLSGNMFTFLDKEGKLNLRLGEEKRNEFIKKFKAALSVQHGVVMKENVAVPDKLLKTTKDLLPWMKSSYEYASTLKPKKTKK